MLKGKKVRAALRLFIPFPNYFVYTKPERAVIRYETSLMRFSFCAVPSTLAVLQKSNI